MIGLVGNNTEKNGASELKEEDYKHAKTLERISSFHRKFREEKREVMWMLVF